MKDDKENFENKPRVRLINLAKNEIRPVSKLILGKINVGIKSQWENTKEVIDWLVSIDEKHFYKFVQFDIKEFYPSIKKPLSGKALKFVEEYMDVLTDDKAVIKHARKSLVFSKRKTWIKKILECLT